MAKDDLYAFNGVILKCDKGATVLPLLTTPKKHAVSKLQIATVTDNIPVVNIPSFGVCSIGGKPCLPVAPKWLKEHNGAQKVLGQAPLLFTSYCKCQAGGTIEIFPSVEAAKAALEKDKESRVDGIPWLDGALGAALTTPVGSILDAFTDGGHDVTEGVGRGFRKGLKGTWNGLVQMVSHPIETAKGLTKMVGIAVVGYGGPIPTWPLYTPEQRLKDFDKTFGTELAPTHAAIGDAIADGWDKKVVNGATEERSEVVGQVYEGVLEAVVGTKGAGLAVKGVTSAGKFVLGAERIAEITAAIAKLQSAMKLEALAGKVRGIFRVGSRAEKALFRLGELIDGIKVVRIKPGKNGKIAIIGRKMDGHVEKVAAELEARGYKVELFNQKGQKFNKFTIDGKTKSWDQITDDFGDLGKYERNDKGWITDKSLPETDMYKANQQWAEKLKAEGYEIVDVGYPSSVTSKSVFYDMEQEIIFNKIN